MHGPTSPRHSTTWARCCTTSKDYEAARRLLQHAIELHPTSPRPTTIWEPCYQEQKRFDEALSHFRRRWSSIPTRPRRWPISAPAWQMLGQHDRRRSNTIAGRSAIDPNLSPAHYSLAAALHLQASRRRGAGRATPRRSASSPTMPRRYYNRSFVHLSQGDFAAGLARLRVAVPMQGLQGPPLRRAALGRLAPGRPHAAGACRTRAGRHAALHPLRPTGRRARRQGGASKCSRRWCRCCKPRALPA